jgi:hypothetical protein
METETSKAIGRDNIWIIEILNSSSGINSNVYSIFITGDHDKPLIKDNKVCFFTKDKAIEKIHKMGLSILPNDFPEEIDLTYDIDKVLALLTLSSIDKDATLINSINFLLDIINALSIKLPDEYKNALYAFADHLTFNRRFGSFLKQSKISRESIINTIYWINGAIISNACFHY